MDMRAEEAWEELARENSLRDLAHDITMAVASRPRIIQHSGNDYSYQCGWCRKWWVLDSAAKRLDPDEHWEACAWRKAKMYASEMGTDGIS